VSALTTLRQAARELVRNPRLTLPVVVLLGLAMGAAGAAFSLVHSILLRPLPFGEPERLAMVWSTSPERAEPDYVAWPDYLDWRRQSRSFAELAAFNLYDAQLTGSGDPEQVPGAAVTADFFGVLGVAPLAGRFFAPGDPERPERDVVVLSDGLWHRRFGGSRAVLGQTVQISGRPVEVIGVAPRSMRQPEPYAGADEAELWVPLVPQSWMKLRQAHSLRVVGRLATGVELPAAQAELAAIAKRLAARFPDTDPGARLVPLQQQLVGDLRPGLLMLMTAMGVLLAVACANAGNQLLAHQLHRERDTQVRVALGASRGWLARQAVWEGLLLALGAGVLGLGLGAWGGAALAGLFPVRVAGIEAIRFSPAAGGFVGLLSLASGALVSLPALLRLGHRSALAPGASSHQRATAGRRARGLRGLLLVAEVAMALPLVVAAALLAQSFLALRRVDPGFRAAGVLTFDLSLPPDRYAGAPQRLALYEALAADLAKQPGVEAAGLAASLPLADANDRELSLIARGIRLPEELDVHYQVASPGFFAALRIPIQAGRGFAPADGPAGARVAILNRGLARRLWPGRDPIGNQVSFDYGPGVAPHWMTVVGIAGDVRQQGLASPPALMVYRPIGQDPLEQVSVVARGRLDGAGLAPVVRAAVWRHDPHLPLAGLRPMQTLVDAESARLSFISLLLDAVAAVALAITVLGIVSLMSYLNRLRAQEVAIRLSLGARRAEVLAALVRPALLLLAAGTALGLAAAVAARSVLAHVLYGIAPGDPLTLGGAALLLFAIGALCAYLTGRGATRINLHAALQGGTQ
jgi:putative ABC transport system permease protein